MTRKRFLIVRFDGQTPVWEEYDGQRLKSASAPGGRTRLPILALIPDRYFFFYHPEGLRIDNERRLKAATLLQMNQLFPTRVEGQERDAVIPGPGGILGYISHPALAAFVEQHRALFDQASVVTTPFLVAWSTAQSRSLQTWTWQDGSGPSAIYADHKLVYLSTNSSEYRDRLTGLGADPAQVTEVSYADALAGLARNQINWLRLRLPLAMLAGSNDDVRPWQRLAVAVALAGVLFCSGQTLRYYDMVKAQKSAEVALQDLYRKSLGQNPGSDPYGQLLYKISQIKGKQSRGTDPMEVLATISRAATGNLKVDSLQLAPESGNLRGKIADYNSMEQFIKTLGEQGQRMNFTLEQAQNADDGVQFSLRVTY